MRIGVKKMSRPIKESERIVIVLSKKVMETLTRDSSTFGMEKSSYLSQLIMQKHLEMTATGLLEKLSPEQIQMFVSSKEGGVKSEIQSIDTGRKLE
jgi:hypothetical protein